MKSPEEPEKLRPLELLDKFEALKGTKIMNDLIHLQTSHYIVINNYRDLIKSIDSFEKDITIMFRDNYGKFILAMREITRRLHNYLASIKSLIDHTSRFRKELDNSKIEEEFKKEIQRLTRNKCTAFVKLFRNYIQHYTLPIVAAHLRVEKIDLVKPDFEENLTIYLDKEKLLKWDNWNQSSIEYMEKYDKEIPLREVFEEYEILNNLFYEWFYDKVREQYKDEINEFRKVSQKLDELFKN